MGERLQTAQHTIVNQVLKRLNIPLAMPPILEREEGPWSESLLKDKRFLLSTNIKGSSLGLLRRLGAVFAFDGKADGILFDGRDLANFKGLHTFFDLIKEYYSELKPLSRVVLVAEPGVIGDALGGFMKSLAKELGKKGGTTNLLLLSSKTELGSIQGTLAFLLSAKASYISGQIISLRSLPTREEWKTSLLCEGQKVLVTGAARGIGRAIAETFHREGASLYLIDHPSQQNALSDLATKLSAKFLALDLLAGDAVQIIEKHLLQLSVRLDVVVNNAGITRDRTFAKMSSDEWDKVIDLNLQLPIELSKRLIESGIVDKKGRVLFLSSVMGISGNFGQTNYATSKAGLNGYVHSKPSRSIRMNAIAPYFIATDMINKMPFFTREIAKRLNSLSQEGTPQDVAELAVFLGSSMSDAISGEVVRICGQSLMG